MEYLYSQMDYGVADSYEDDQEDSADDEGFVDVPTGENNPDHLDPNTHVADDDLPVVSQSADTPQVKKTSNRGEKITVINK